MNNFIIIFLITVTVGTAIFLTWCAVLSFITHYFVDKALENGTGVTLTDHSDNPFEGDVSQTFRIIETKRNNSGKLFVKYEDVSGDRISKYSHFMNYDEIRVMDGNGTILLVETRVKKTFLPPKVKVNNLRKGKNVP